MIGLGAPVRAPDRWREHSLRGGGALFVFALGLAFAPGAAEAAAPDVLPARSAAAAASIPTAPALTSPRLTLKPKAGFYDDAWALDPTGNRLAVIHTNRDDFQRVEVYDLNVASGAGGDNAPEAAPVATFELLPASRVFQSLSFLPGGGGFLLVTSAPGDARIVETVDAQGKPLGKVGPTTDFGLPDRSKDPQLVTFDRRPGKAGDTTYVVAPYKLPRLQAAGKARAHLVKADGTLRAPPLVPVAFFDGYSKLLAQRTGWYDKKRDARQPDARAVVDLLTGKTITDAPIEDVYGWARTTRLRREHPNRTAFVMLADAVPGEAGVKAGVELLDPAGRLLPLPLAVPFRLYDRFTLKDQEDTRAGLIHFGIQVDPVNPDAVARKKADAAALDVYTVSTGGDAGAGGEACRLRARVPVGAQPVAWAVAGKRLVVLRRFKSFVRGGDGIEVYDLAP